MQVPLERSPDKPAGFVKRKIRQLVRSARWFKILLKNGKKIKIGKNCHVGSGAEVYIPHRMILGNNISIGSSWLSQVNLNIGNDCLISSRVAFIGNDHDLFNINYTSYLSGRLPPAQIILEGNNFIGFGAVILGNVVIGKDALVAAGALVNKDVPNGTIVAGVPARIIGERYKAKEEMK